MDVRESADPYPYLQLTNPRLRELPVPYAYLWLTNLDVSG